MLELDWRLHDADGVTLVAVVVESTAPTPRRVRIESRLAGPVHPPRRRGHPERGWSGDGYEGLVPAEGRLTVGFASLAEPTEPPVEIVTDERVDAGAVDGPPITDAAPDGRTDLTDVWAPSPTDLLRELGSPAPPRDAVPDSEPVTVPPQEARDETGPAGDGLGSADESGRDPDGTDSVARAPEAPGSTIRDPEAPDSTARDPEATDSTASDLRDATVRISGEVPDPVACWLTCVDARVERAERLAEARELRAAADEVEAVGGLAGVEELLATLATDRTVLRAVARETEMLAERCDAAEAVPLDAYWRLS